MKLNILNLADPWGTRLKPFTFMFTTVASKRVKATVVVIWSSKNKIE